MFIIEFHKLHKRYLKKHLLDCLSFTFLDKKWYQSKGKVIKSTVDRFFSQLDDFLKSRIDILRLKSPNWVSMVLKYIQKYSSFLNRSRYIFADWMLTAKTAKIC